MICRPTPERRHLGSSSFRDVCCHDYIQQFDLEISQRVLLHGRAIFDHRGQCGMSLTCSSGKLQ